MVTRSDLAVVDFELCSIDGTGAMTVCASWHFSHFPALRNQPMPANDGLDAVPGDNTNKDQDPFPRLCNCLSEIAHEYHVTSCNHLCEPITRLVANALQGIQRKTMASTHFHFHGLRTSLVHRALVAVVLRGSESIARRRKTVTNSSNPERNLIVTHLIA